MSEVTIIGEQPTVRGAQQTSNESGTWKHVTLGGVTGILMGAGLLYGGQVAAKAFGEEPAEEEASVPEEGLAENDVLRVATTHDNMSFGDAFEAARAEVGAGGVFHWHNGIYNTFTSAEWNAMSDSEKRDFAELVKPEVDAHHVSTPTDKDPYVVVIYTEEDVDEPEVPTDDGDVMIVDTNGNGVLDSDDYLIDTYGHVARYGDLTHENEPYELPADDSDVTMESDVIMGVGNVAGHDAVGLDINTDGNLDVAVIDVNDNSELDYDDVLIDTNGNKARYGDLAYENDPSMNPLDNPDVADDMPDYMSDVLLDA